MYTNSITNTRESEWERSQDGPNNRGHTANDEWSMSWDWTKWAFTSFGFELFLNLNYSTTSHGHTHTHGFTCGRIGSLVHWSECVLFSAVQLSGSSPREERSCGGGGGDPFWPFLTCEGKNSLCVGTSGGFKGTSKTVPFALASLGPLGTYRATVGTRSMGWRSIGQSWGKRNHRAKGKVKANSWPGARVLGGFASVCFLFGPGRRKFASLLPCVCLQRLSPFDVIDFNC